MAQSDPIEPFGASVSGVSALVPAAPVLDALQPGQKGVTAAQVALWVEELSEAVDLRLAGRERLRNEARLASLLKAARGVIHNGAASYLESARFAERAAVADTTYGEVLWKRYTDGLRELVDMLTAWLSDQDDSTPEANNAPAWSFPETSFPDGMRF
jgi:hypothetical protein